MARLKLFFGFFFFLVGCGLAMFLLVMSFDENYDIVNSELLMIWFGGTAVFSILVGVFILTKE